MRAVQLAVHLPLLLAIACRPPPVRAANALEAAVHAIAHTQDFNGVVLVGRGSRVAAMEKVGSANFEAHVPVTANTRFETGSLSKWVASIVVLMLVDRGTLDLDAPISTYLPDFRADSGARLTLRQLLSHSSGVPNDLLAARKADPSARAVELDQREAVRRYASGALVFEPGSAWDYSHSNWLIVKEVVERTTGKTYGALLGALLLEPLGLKDSGLFHGDSGATRGLAISYAGAQPGAARNASPAPEFMAMAGGYYTTATDLLELMHAVLSGDVLQPETREALTHVLRPAQHYALGGRVRIEPIAGVPRFTAWEDGSNGGFRVLARRVIADGTTVIVMSNTSLDHQKLGAMGDALMEAAYR